MTRPRIIHAAINLTDGTVHLTFSEIVDQTPHSDVNLSGIIFRDITGPEYIGIPLEGANVDSTDDVYINISLTEAQRAAIIAISGTPGGNGTSVKLDVNAGAVTDVLVSRLYQQPLLQLRNTLIRNHLKLRMPLFITELVSLLL